MSWQFEVLDKYYYGFYYLTPLEGQKVLQVPIPSSSVLFSHQRRSLLLGAGLSCLGSYDCKNLRFTIAEGPPGSGRNIYSFTLKQLKDAGLVGLDAVPTISVWDDTNKQYTVVWNAKSPWPVRGISVEYSLPGPSLDTATVATLIYTYILISLA